MRAIDLAARMQQELQPDDRVLIKLDAQLRSVRTSGPLGLLPPPLRSSAWAAAVLSTAYALGPVPLVLCDSSIAWQVEGGEYTLLPHLLVSGALCLADYLHVEWHPNAIAATSASSNETQLLEGLSLRQAMQLVLKGCARPPTAVSHEGLRQKEYMRYAMGCQGGRKPS